MAAHTLVSSRRVKLNVSPDLVWDPETSEQSCWASAALMVRRLVLKSTTFTTSPGQSQAPGLGGSLPSTPARRIWGGNE